MRIAFVLPGLHRHNRGAEIAFISIARELSRTDDVTLIGSGDIIADTPYKFIRAASCPRERFERYPFFPPLRHEFAYEELTFVPALLRAYKPANYDATITCSYPFTNWVLRRPTLAIRRPAHIFVTQNGDWPAFADNSEYKFFGCEGLVCINPEYVQRNRDRWNCRLIPNGVDCNRFKPGSSDPRQFGLPSERPVVLMVSALIESKNVIDGIRAAHLVPGIHLAIAGDGPLRDEVDRLGHSLLPNRFSRFSVSPEKMPSLYRSAKAFMHLSNDEPFGNVFLEALSTGLPIVANNSPRTRWIVGEDEFFFANREPEAIASAIRHAVASDSGTSMDRIFRASGFSWQAIAGQYRDFLTEIVSGPKGHPGQLDAK